MLQRLVTRPHTAGPISLLVRGWLAYVPVGVLLVFSYDDRLVTPSLAAAGALAIFLHFRAAARLHERGPLPLWLHAGLSYLLAFGGCFLALQVPIIVYHPSVRSFFGVEVVQFRCWFCPSGWDETHAALMDSIFAAMYVLVLSPLSWTLARRTHPARRPA